MTVETNVKDAAITLPSCPFCGAEVEVLRDMHRTWGLVKHRDGCFFSNFRFHVIQEYDFDAWNRRHVETCHDKNGFDESLGFECTVCRTMVDSYMQTTCSDKREQFHYCPSCGRKVEG